MNSEKMTSRQRVLKAINHEEIDRIPIDLGVQFSTGISVFAYKRLREYLGLSTDNIHIVDNVQMLARVDEDILKRFHCDAMILNPEWKNPVKWNVRNDETFYVSDTVNPELNEKGEWIVKSGDMSMRMPKNGYFFDRDWLLANEYKTEEEMLNAYAKRAEWIYKETDYFTMQMGFTSFFDDIEFACQMYTEPDEVVKIQKERLKVNLHKMKKIIKRYGKYAQAIEINSDLGSQKGPLLRPEMYEKYCYPYLKEFLSYIHENSDIKIFMHSCGSVSAFIPMLINAGIDILNPIQISADNMEPKELKQKYGDKLCFWGGGCDTQSILPNGSIEDVKQNVTELIEIFKPNSGFVFNQVHNIVGNISPENIVTMLDTAYSNSFY